MSEHRTRKRREDVRRRMAVKNVTRRSCAVIGCGQPVTAITGKGLNTRFCKRHEDQLERHGSAYKGSYTAAQLAPYKKAALAWLKAHEDDPVVRVAVNAVADLYVRAGPRVEAFRLRGLSPEDRARAVWAAIRDKRIEAWEVVAVWLALVAAIKHDPQTDWRPEYRRTQGGKVLHRMAGGSHKRWEREDGRGGVKVTELHKHTHSRGHVLRHLGEQLERAAGIASSGFLLDQARA